MMFLGAFGGVFVAANTYWQREPVNELVVPMIEEEGGSLTASNDLVIEGDLVVNGEATINGKISFDGLDEILVGLEEGGATEVYNTYTTQVSSLDDDVFFVGDEAVTLVGLGNTDPQAKFQVNTTNSGTVGLAVQAEVGQTANLLEILHSGGQKVARIDYQGKLILDNNADHQIEIRPSGSTGYLSSSGGAIFMENTYNTGTGIGIYSNAGSEALGNMINVKVDNPNYGQAAFYMNYDGTSNAVEIVANTDDSSSNALSITNYNKSDSALGVIGYETGRGTVKITHRKDGTDTNASGLSVDLQGTGTAAQGIYVDSTASGGTSGNLLRLRNQTIDRFVVSSVGSLALGANGTNTSITKYGNTTGDEFFVGTNGAFRVQRSATDSEAFRTQIVGDTQGRWLGTADGKLKFGNGSSAQDVVIERTGVGLFQMDTDVVVLSQATNNDVLTLTASDGSRLGRFTETSGGHGWFEVDNASGTAVVMLRADGGNSYVSTGNFGVGTTEFGTSASKVLALGNGTAPTTSPLDMVQLYAVDYDDGDGASSELFVRDEDGNATNLSPHNFSIIPDGASEAMAWSYYSVRDDVAISADMTRALRLVEGLTGEKLVYTKDLVSGEYVGSTEVSEADFVGRGELDEKLGEAVNEVLTRSVTKAEMGENMSWTGRLITFVKEVVFKSKAIFEGTVEYLAGVTFKGSITVNADTAGEVMIPAGTTKFRVKFESVFGNKPLVYVSTDSVVEYRVVGVTKEGFEVVLTPVSEEVGFRWLALMSEGDDISRLEVVESSGQTNETELVEEKVEGGEEVANEETNEEILE